MNFTRNSGILILNVIINMDILLCIYKYPVGREQFVLGDAGFCCAIW